MATLDKFDPSRTFLIRRQFVTDFRRRFKKISSVITKFIDTEDSFGLRARREPVFKLAREYAFLTDAQKLNQFKMWLTAQVEAGFLTPIGGVEGKPWTAQYVESAYQKGILRAYTDTHAAELVEPAAFYEGGREQFLLSTFNTPLSVEKLQMLQTRTFEAMEGLTVDMKKQLNYHLAQGLSRGESPLKIARTMRKSIAGLSRTRALRIARTEIVRAQAEGQLTGFERLGIEKVGAKVEWSTAGDQLVCVECDEMEGEVFTIKEARGLIPLHPNCRCAWVPVG
jgi:SPP1 gp7 family putative phage head morphogenesis protein